MIALYDWDAFAYRAAFAAQTTIRHVSINGEGRRKSPKPFKSAADMKAWLKDNDLEREDVEIREQVKVKKVGHAIRVLEAGLNRSAAYLHSDECELYITGENNFRKLIYPEYKANRTRPKPVHLAAVLDHSVRRLHAEVVDEIEADDKLSIRATELDAEGKDWVIVSPDKDLLTVPGHHYNPFTNTYKVVDPHEAAFNFYCQCLTGDNADNIPGIYGIGPKKAEAILDECLYEDDMYKTVLGVYQEKGLDEEVLIRNARLLHMLRHPLDLWEPPSAN